MAAAESEGRGGFGTLGANPMIEFWNDMMVASTSFWQDQALLWAGFVQRMMGGSAPPTERQPQEGARDVWSRWGSLWTSPLWWWMRYQADPPTVILVADEQAETVGPSVVQTLVSVPDASTVEVSDLHPIGGGAVLPKKHLDVQFRGEGNRLEVKLVELGPPPRSEKGLFAAVVYSKERATLRPLALIVAYIEATPTQASAATRTA